MDPVRLGKVLGAGARAAAKTAVAAVGAASAPNPAPAPRSPVRTSTFGPPPSTSTASHTTTKNATRPAAATATAAGLTRGAKRFGREVWNPLVRVSGVLWLEVTGVFFGIFALFALGAAWRLRGAWNATTANSPEHQRLIGAIVMGVVFGYFCTSSFVRANRRARNR